MPDAIDRRTQKVIKKADKALGRKTPKKPFTTTGIIMDSRHLQTLRACAELRVIRGDADRSSVSHLVREAVAEYIERHSLSSQEYFFNNMAELSRAQQIGSEDSH